MTVRSPSGKWTYDEYAAIPPDLLRHEIIDGEHCVNPAPNVYHQRVSGRLYVELFRRVDEAGSGEVYAAPIDVQLSEHDIVQPDLVVILDENRDIVKPSRIIGTPDLVVEILSPGTRHHDTTRKKERYHVAGVPEYWIVDPDAQTIEQHRLSGDAYQLLGTERQTIVWSGCPGVTIDLIKVW